MEQKAARELEAGPPDVALALDAAGLEDARAAEDAAADAGASCTGACATTALVAQFGAAHAELVRAQHGRDGESGLRVEAHHGGDPACPEMGSPTPDRTLVLSGLFAEDRVQTEADGVHATLFDFSGALTEAPLLRATRVRVTPRYLDRGVEVSFTIEVEFPGGTIGGGVYAPHCDSLD